MKKVATVVLVFVIFASLSFGEEVKQGSNPPAASVAREEKKAMTKIKRSKKNGK